MKENSVRLAITGCGWATRHLHLPAIRRLKGISIVAVSDPREAALRDFGDALTFGDWHQMLAGVQGACDAVLVATPPDSHADIALAAMDRDLHMMIEKPVATYDQEAQRLVARADTYPGVIGVGFNMRCHPALVRLREDLRTGSFGNLQTIRVTWHSGAGFGARDWLGVRRRGGGALMDLGSHIVDLWRFLGQQDIVELTANSVSALIDDQSATLDGRLSDGTQLIADLSLVSDDRFTIEVVGSRRRRRIRPYGRLWRQSYDRQWLAFQTAVEGRGEVAAGLSDGVTALAWLQQVTRDLAPAAVASPPATVYPLTAIASTPTGYAALRTTVAHLRRQTVVDQIELILVGPSEDALVAPQRELSGFAAVSTVAIGPVTSIGAANAAGVRRARGRVVVLTEDHCFPDPDWAAALIEAHRPDDVSAVGPVVKNGNPGTQVSEADYAIGYGPWMAPMPARAMPFLAGHNSSYKRDDLLALGGRLERLLEAETVLHFEWTAQGRQLLVEPCAQVSHVNYSRWRSWLPVQLLAGRHFGGLRASTWPVRRRLFYAAASPLIPLVRFARIAREFFRPGRRPLRLARMSPALVIGLLLDGVGQGVGYLLGPGGAMAQLSRYEFNRIDHVRPRDRRLWISP
jgi:predicted dehydrogenase